MNDSIKIINPSVELLPLPNSLEANIIAIERAGRTCYKSNSNYDLDSASAFFNMVIKRGHTSVIEHGYLIVRVSKFILDELINLLISEQQPIFKFINVITLHENDSYILSINYRSILNLIDYADNALKSNTINNILLSFIRTIVNGTPLETIFNNVISKYTIGEINKYTTKSLLLLTENIIINMAIDNIIAESDALYLIRRSFRTITSRGVTHEHVRHRLQSYSQESTRYVKYDRQMEFIMPQFKDKELFSSTVEILHNYNYIVNENNINEFDDIAKLLFAGYLESFKQYKELLGIGVAPQRARGILPNDLKTEIVATSSLNDWQHYLSLRCSSAAHPDIRVIANSIKNLLRKEYPYFKDRF